MSDLPDWSTPPQMIGGYVAGPVPIARSGSIVVAARQVLAFPTGVEVEIEAHARGPHAGPAPDPAAVFGHPPLQFHVRFADGREATQDDETGLRSGLGPMLVLTGCQTSSGGPGGREDVRQTLWIWPLPSPGPVAVTCSWPDRGLHGAGLVLDGDAIAAAARLAQPFWPEPGS